MNCCWILLLLLCGNRSGCGFAVPFNSNNCCGRRDRESADRRNADRRDENRRDENRRGENRRHEDNRNADRRNEQDNDCGCGEVRSEPRMENRDGCDVASTIPQPWQEYARRDSDDCRD